MYKKLNFLLSISALVLGYLFFQAKQDEYDDHHPALEASIEVFNDDLNSQRYGFERRLENSNISVMERLTASPIHNYLDSVQSFLDSAKEIGLFKIKLNLINGVMTLDNFTLKLDSSLWSWANDLEELDKHDGSYSKNLNWQRHKVRQYLSLYQADFMKRQPILLFDDLFGAHFKMLVEQVDTSDSIFLKISPKLWLRAGANAGLELLIGQNTIENCDEIVFERYLEKPGHFDRKAKLILHNSKTGEAINYPFQLKYQVR